MSSFSNFDINGQSVQDISDEELLSAVDDVEMAMLRATALQDTKEVARVGILALGLALETSRRLAARSTPEGAIH